MSKPGGGLEATDDFIDRRKEEEEEEDAKKEEREADEVKRKEEEARNEFRRKLAEKEQEITLKAKIFGTKRTKAPTQSYPGREINIQCHYALIIIFSERYTDHHSLLFYP